METEEAQCTSKQNLEQKTSVLDALSYHTSVGLWLDTHGELSADHSDIPFGPLHICYSPVVQWDVWIVCYCACDLHKL